MTVAVEIVVIAREQTMNARPGSVYACPTAQARSAGLTAATGRAVVAIPMKPATLASASASTLSVARSVVERGRYVSLVRVARLSASESSVALMDVEEAVAVVPSVHTRAKTVSVFARRVAGVKNAELMAAVEAVAPVANIPIAVATRAIVTMSSAEQAAVQPVRVVTKDSVANLLVRAKTVGRTGVEGAVVPAKARRLVKMGSVCSSSSPMQRLG